MNTDLKNWTKNWSLIGAFFSQPEIEELRRRLSGLQPRHVVICSFENRFARSGGLAPVTMNTPPALMATGLFTSVTLLSPFYPYLMNREELSAAQKFDVLYDGRRVGAQLLKFDVPHSSSAITEYYVAAEGAFGARNPLRDPYLYVDDDPAANDEILRENALWFCKAVPAALAALRYTADVVLHLQEWQTAPVCLTVKDAMLDGSLEACGTVQTLHNPFDTFISKRHLKRLTTDTRRQARIEQFPVDGLTAFELGLQLVDAPVATVSENFAKELTTDILQTEHFAPHLQAIFRRHPVVGINNGPFIGFSTKYPNREHHTLDEISLIKRDQRHALLDVLATYHPEQHFGELTYRGGTIRSLPDEIPIFVMSGRLDPFQKGYDILLQVLERFPIDAIKAILTPMSLRASDLAYFRDVADSCRGNVTVFSMRMQAGYLELQTGSTFGIMPSIYEPFGAAIEYMVSGTPNLVRRTGGLVDQVDHGSNGLRYRERPDSYDLRRIRDFIAASNSVKLRKNNKWAVDMADALYDSVKEAIALYRYKRNDYNEMIRRGFAKAQTFSWENTALEYSAIYQKVAVV